MLGAKAIPFLFLLLVCLSQAGTVNAQSEDTLLRQGQPVERTITRRMMHIFNISMEQNQVLRLVVEQHGIDVVVRVFSPGGKSMGEFDTPNGTKGPENVALIADTAGLYRIVVTPLEVAENESSGRYEIKVLELRPASGAELESIKKIEAAKTKSRALLSELAGGLQQLRLPETRVRLQIQAAQLLLSSDEKLAGKLMDDAAEGVREYLAGVETDDHSYYQNYQHAIQLRNEVVMGLATRNPEAALNFLRSTRTLVDPNQGPGSEDQEQRLELALAAQVATKNSKLALRIAEESLKKGYSYSLVQTLLLLQTTDREAASKLAVQIADKLQNENLLKNPAAANIVFNLLQMARPSITTNQTTAGGSEEAKPPLLPEQKYRELFGKALSSALSYVSTDTYSNERNSAQNLLNSIKSLTPEMERYAPDKIQLVEKRSTELNQPPDPQSRLWQKYQTAINDASLDAALENARQAPQELRDQLYNQVAQKALQNGDIARARQILTDHVKNPLQLRQALMNLEHQAVYQAINKGNIEEALSYVGNLRKPTQQAALLIQMFNQAMPTQKRATSLRLLEQAQALVGRNGRAADHEQMNVLLELARAFLQLEPKRAYEIIEPLVNQFNEMNVAAVALNGFGQHYYRDGELMMQNGNTLSTIAGQLIQFLAALAVTDFDSARATADMINRPEVRLSAYLAMIQQTIGERPNERVIRYSAYSINPVDSMSSWSR